MDKVVFVKFGKTKVITGDDLNREETREEGKDRCLAELQGFMDGDKEDARSLKLKKDQARLDAKSRL